MRFVMIASWAIVIGTLAAPAAGADAEQYGSEPALTANIESGLLRATVRSANAKGNTHLVVAHEDRIAGAVADRIIPLEVKSEAFFSLLLRNVRLERDLSVRLLEVPSRFRTFSTRRPCRMGTQSPGRHHAPKSSYMVLRPRTVSTLELFPGSRRRRTRSITAQGHTSRNAARWSSCGAHCAISTGGKENVSNRRRGSTRHLAGRWTHVLDAPRTPGRPAARCPGLGFRSHERRFPGLFPPQRRWRRGLHRPRSNGARGSTNYVNHIIGDLVD